MKLCFDSIEEVKDFVGNLKGTRGKKGEAEDAASLATGTAPAPIQPPANPPMTFAPPPGAPVTPPMTFAPAGPAPEIVALVKKITDRLDGALQSGQPAEQALTWFRSQCGAEAAAATMDQIKSTFLPKMSQPTLENIAKLMGCT